VADEINDLQSQLDLLAQIGQYDEARKLAAAQVAADSKKTQDALEKQIDTLQQQGKLSKQLADLRKKEVSDATALKNSLTIQNQLHATATKLAQQQYEAAKNMGKTMQQIIADKRKELELAEQLAREQKEQAEAAKKTAEEQKKAATASQISKHAEGVASGQSGAAMGAASAGASAAGGACGGGMFVRDRFAAHRR